MTKKQQETTDPKKRSLMTPILIALTVVAAFLHGAAYVPFWVGSGPAATVISWRPPKEIASGSAFAGPWRMNESEFHYVDDPTVVMQSTDYFALAWVDNEVKDIFFQQYDNAGKAVYARPVNVSRSAEVFSWLPRMAVDGERVYLLWQEIVFSGGSHGGEIFFAASNNGGESFSQPINISNTIAGAGKGRVSAHRWDNGSLDLALAKDGAIYAAWTEYEGRLHLSRSLDGGISFSLPLHISGDDQTPARGPALTVDKDSTVHLVWSMQAEDRGNIYYTFSTDRGESFHKEVKVTTASSRSDAPRLAIDSKDTLHLVFFEQTSKFFWGKKVFYSRKSIDEKSFEDPRLISTRGGGALSGSGYPDIALDGNNNLFVIWHLFPPSSRPLGVGFTISTNGGDDFTPAAIVPGTVESTLGAHGNRQGFLSRRLSATGNGQIALVTSTFNKGHSSHIWLIQGELK